MKKILMVFMMVLFSGAFFYARAQEFKDGRAAVVGRFPQYQSQQFTKADGLCGNNVVDLKIDKSGKLWISTSDVSTEVPKVGELKIITSVRRCIFDDKTFKKVEKDQPNDISGTLFTISRDLDKKEIDEK